MGQCQTGSGEEHSADRSQGKDLSRKSAETKKENYLIGYSLKPS